MKLTPWFDGNVKPVREGVYERQFWAPFSYWDGEYWLSGSGYPDVAANCSARNGTRVLSEKQNRPWRGLAKQPKEQA